MKKRVTKEALKIGASTGVLVLMYTMYMARQLEEDPYALNVAAAAAIMKKMEAWKDHR
jgi:uncharacterized membrane protein